MKGLNEEMAEECTVGIFLIFKEEGERILRPDGALMFEMVSAMFDQRQIKFHFQLRCCLEQKLPSISIFFELRHYKTVSGSIVVCCS